MSTSAAKGHANKARQATTIEEKLDELAKAIYEIARTLSDIEHKTDRIK